MKPVIDTHRLTYRNARIRAFDLSDRTTPLEFFNVTDNILPETPVGTEVYTDAAGYIYYGQNSQPIQCLAVKKSAIIQVDLHHNGAWDIEWILRNDSTDDFVKVEDVHKAFYANGELAWDPLSEDWQMPDFALKSDIGRGEWAEGEMTVSEDTPYDLNIDKWTHIVTIRNGHAGRYRLLHYRGRYGQTIRIMNISDTDVVIVAQHRIGGRIYEVSVVIPANTQSEASYSGNIGWYMMRPTTVLDTNYIIDQPTGNSTTHSVDLDLNPQINQIILNTTEVHTVYIKYSGDDDPLIKFTNNTEIPVAVRRLVPAGPSSFQPSVFGEVIPEKTSLEIAVYPQVVRITDGSQSGYVTIDAHVLTNTNTCIVHTPGAWYGTIELTTELIGRWLPIHIYAKGGSTQGDAQHTIKLKINDIVVYELETSANHIMGESTTSPVYVPPDTSLLSANIKIYQYYSNDELQTRTDVQIIHEV